LNPEQEKELPSVDGKERKKLDGPSYRHVPGRGKCIVAVDR